jgi:hypothetical protein
MKKQISQKAVETPHKRPFRHKRSHYSYDRTLTEDMYREVMQLYPPLQKSRAYRNLFAYIALGPHYADRDTGYTLLPARLLASFEGKLGQYYAHHYSAEAFLKRYRRDVDPAFKWSRWSKQDKKARALIADGTQELTRRFLYEQDEQARRRYLGSGKVLNDQNQRRYQREYVQEAQAQEWLYHDQALIANYLHDLPLSMFKRQVAKHYREAMKYALEHGDVQDILTLKAIRDMPMPFYHVDPPNARLFPSQGLATIKREIRHILLQEWIELDLVNCQAAIVAGIWHIDSVNAVLASGHSIWDALLYELGVKEEQRIQGKEALKEPVYALVFGMERHHLERFTSEQLAGLDRTNEKAFLDIPMLQEIMRAQIMRAREQALIRIKVEGGSHTPYRWFACDEDIPIRSFMVYVVQSFELALVAAACKKAAERKDVRIALYQFDGLTITSNNPSVLNELDRAVQKRGKELGIIARMR